MTPVFLVLGEYLKMKWLNSEKWFDMNKLSGNWSKTKFMSFTNREQDEGVSLSISGSS